VFLAAAAASAATLLMLAPVIVRKLDFSFDRPLYKELLRFGLPLIPAGLASMVVQVIDRPILMALTSGAAVGIYTANYKLGIFMQMVVNMFDMAWRPFILPRGDEPGVKKLIARVLTYFCAGGAFVVLAVSLFIKDLVALPLMGGKPLIHPSYWPGLPIVPVVLLGYFFNGVYYNFLAPINLAKRNDLVVIATALGAVVNVAANLLLIPRLDIMGAAWATLAAYFAMALALYALGNQVFPVEYEWPRLARLAGVFAVCGVLARWAADGTAATRAGVLLSLPVLLGAVGFFSPEELAAARRRLSRFA
jgi:O-antigen/teichoic acid export membrane protein